MNYQPAPCRICKSTGLALVPMITVDPATGHHIRHTIPVWRIVDGVGKWVQPEIPNPVMTRVVCTCSRGEKWKQSRIKGLDGYERERMGLDHYEMRLNPNWENELLDIERMRRDRYWAQVRDTSPFRQCGISDDHTAEGQQETAYTYLRSKGMQPQEIFGLARQHPAWVYLGELSHAIAGDVLRHWEGQRKAIENIVIRTKWGAKKWQPSRSA